MRKLQISQGEYYHVFNRGNDKQKIFLNKSDYARFLFLLLHLQANHSFPNASRPVKHFVKHSVFNIDSKVVAKIAKEKHVELLGFALMPNHFHLILGEKTEGGIARYMQKVLNAYTKYFNTRYERSGHLFQGPYKAVHLKDNEHLLYVSAYVHRNCCDLPGWRGKEKLYLWSSLQDYVEKNRWLNNLLDQDLIQSQFANRQEYEKWVAASGAKENDDFDLANSDC